MTATVPRLELAARVAAAREAGARDEFPPDLEADLGVWADEQAEREHTASGWGFGER